MSDFERFEEPIKRNRFSERDKRLPKEFLLHAEGDLSVFYAPVDYVNTQARVAICGITPGLQQALLAFVEVKKQLIAGMTFEDALKQVKKKASFGGPMRAQLVSMLDHICVNQKLGIESCKQLFDTHAHLVHCTSALRYPVFVNGDNYRGKPNMLSIDLLRRQIDKGLVEEFGGLAKEFGKLPKNCIYIPLGPIVAEALSYLVSKGVIESSKVLDGMPHPSGANAERIKYFIGEKSKESLSQKTNPSKIDEAKGRLLAKLAAM